MKENKLIEMRNKIEILGSVIQQMTQEMANLKDLSIGTMSLLKKFPDYKKAIEELKKDLEKNKEKNNDKLEQ
jgi:predicted ATP-grasp superfamily ATP-dependent carboligase